MNLKTSGLLLLFFLCLGWVSLSQANPGIEEEAFPGNTKRNFREAAKFRLEFDNDVVFGSDNAFSNAWSFQIHTPVADNWDSVQGVSQWVKDFGGWLPSLSGEGLKYRVSGSMGQLLQTPDDIEAANNISNDFPYAGIMAFQGSWIAYNDDQFRGFEIAIGVVGRPSLAEQSQNFVHTVIGNEVADGWDNQLEDEPVININYMRKKKFYKAETVDVSVSGLAAVGTMFTLADIRLETRYGKNKPGGFAYTPDPIGRAITYDATLSPPNPKEASYYATLILGAAAIGHNILLDGNVFRDGPDNDIEKESATGFVILGFNYARNDWGIHFSWAVTTDAIKDESIAKGAEAQNDFGTIMFEWRID
jgi:hypothetical protein